MYLASYRGDPGFFGTLGKIAGTALGVGGSLLPGPAGALVRTVGTVFTRRSPRTPGFSPQLPPIPPRPGGFTGLRLGGPTGIQVGVEKYQREGVRGRADISGLMSPGGECPKGFRLNKTGYFLKGGSYVPPRSKCVKIRYRDVGNTRALRKAVSRASGFDKLVKRNRKALRALARI